MKKFNIKIVPIKFIVVIFLSFFVGCVANKEDIKYATDKQVKYTYLPSQNAKMFYGVYRGYLQYRAAITDNKGDKRIVIINDLGIKMIDFEIKKDGQSFMYFFMKKLPKKSADDFVLFFSQTYFSKTPQNTKEEDNKLYYYGKEKNPILWISQE